MDIPTPLTRPEQWLDLSSMIFGDKIGSGCSRTVYTYVPDPNRFVIKIAQEDPTDNFSEAAVWEAVKGHDVSVWFAPVQYISKNGQLLVQRRTRPLHPCQVPRLVPVFIDDPHSENWGMLDGRAVVHDYAYHNLMRTGARTTRLRTNPAYRWAMRVLAEQKKLTGDKNLTLRDISWP